MKMGTIEKALVNRPTKASGNAARVRAHLDQLAPWVGKDALELGAGIADVSASLVVERGYRATATDVDHAQIELARRRHDAVAGISFSVEDAADLGFPDATFDLVVSQNVFHHVPDWRAAVREVARVLRPGGRLLWLDLAAPRWLKPLLAPLSQKAGVYTAAEVRDAFRAAGLTETSASRVFHGLATHYDLVLTKAVASAAA